MATPTSVHDELEAETCDYALTVAGDRRLVIRRRNDSDVVTILEPGRSPAITITVTAAAVIVSVDGAALDLKVDGAVTIDAESIALTARKGVTVVSGGDARVEAAGELAMTARAQRITANQGDVRVSANDDVDLRGERIRLNC